MNKHLDDFEIKGLRNILWV